MSRRPKPSPLPSNPQWYKDAIIYEIPVRAFYDGNGDGIGDFPGLIEKLDYVQDLGATAVWLLPFYPSPLRDGGYDIADYADVNPMYGTLNDFQHFLDEAHKRNIRVITELVINHTSNEHPWFQRARRSPPGSRWRNFYVWSDSPERYKDARIIFQDFETANWSWDPVAKAYYWHRFYSHQPDLNFENPEVQTAIFQILDFWMSMGVDGLRLDAIPYLYEREGTNCENLPETHEFLKELRKYIDDRYADKMLLAEANQWPEDAAEYFGDGDECHMNFHFPLMPRMFMAVQLESSFPILDILEQTPKVHETCQWAIFLRNHDELTLEMVTDEDRDFMYRMYADDPRARINLGIRRRLAPLLKERRKIELMHALLFSMPGTPVLYYGDEIGMGDNIYLGDRDGVRTPMQWSADRNAGFSRANPQRLYLPVIIDPEYHCEAINVEAQQNNAFSLLWWMKRIIALRKQYEVFGRGEFEFLRPRNNKVLAFFRHNEKERVLVVANLSRFSQFVELDLSEFRGMVPMELFGHVEFPRVGEQPYVITLAPHGFYWLAFEHVEGVQEVDTSDLPVVSVTERWEQVLEGHAQGRLERIVQPWLTARRWFRGKGRKRRGLRLVETVPLGGAESQTVLTLWHLEYVDGTSEVYVLPLGFATGDHERTVQAKMPNAILARIDIEEGGSSQRSGVLYDAAAATDLSEAFLDIIRPGADGRSSHRQRGAAGFLRSGPVTPEELPEVEAEPRALSLEQSNTSVVFGDAYMLKIFRLAEAGMHPEEEMGAFLTRRANFPHTPKLLGTVHWQQSGSDTSSVVAVLQEFVHSEGDAWGVTLDRIGQSYDRVLESGVHDHDPPRGPQNLIERARMPIPDDARELLGSFYPLCRQLGQRIGEMHLALASDPDDPAFAPEPFSLLYQRSLYQSTRGLMGTIWDKLEHTLEQLPDSTHEDVQWALGQRQDIDLRLRNVYKEKYDALRIRCHGDLHLGQVLHTGADFKIIDFEGEPARPMAERRFKRNPLRDVAGMLRSFHYAAMTALWDGRERPEDAKALEPWAQCWVEWASATLLEAWLETTENAKLVPKDVAALTVMLDFYLLDKCIYEVGYELGNRPAWLPVPLRGLRVLLAGGSSEPGL